MLIPCQKSLPAGRSMGATTFENLVSNIFSVLFKLVLGVINLFFWGGGANQNLLKGEK